MSLLASQLYSPSLDLIMLVIAIIFDVVLALLVIQSNPKSATNRIFALLTLTTVCWLTITHIVRSPELLEQSLLLHRLGIFFAAPMSLFFLLLAHTTPSERILMRRPLFFGALFATLVMMAINISPMAFTGITITGETSEPIPGPGLLPFSVISTLFSVLAIYVLVRRYRAAHDVERKQLGLVLLGICIMLALIILTILVPVIASGSLAFLPFTPLYALIFLGLTAYAITKYQLFDIKVLLTQVLTAIIILVLFAKIFGEESRNAQIIDGLVLAFMFVFGFFLVRSVRREVEQRVLIEAQRKELEVANLQQENLLHFISHEIKGYLTEGQNAFAAIVEGDFGTAPPKIHELAARALDHMRRGVSTVMDILDASNLKKGTVTYKKEKMDVRGEVEAAVTEMRPFAAKKQLTLELTVDSRHRYDYMGDKEKLHHHVFRNLIDNAIRYTPKGSIHVTLTRMDHAIGLSVKDTGVGITAEDKSHLFTEGGHGKESIKVNVDSTGYGLFVAKQVVEAHGGRIWAESAGAGKGSEFIVELPL